MSYELFVGPEIKGSKEVALVNTETGVPAIEGKWEAGWLYSNGDVAQITSVSGVHTVDSVERYLRLWMTKRIATFCESITPDMVNSPPHYQLLPGVEVYDVRMALLAKMEDVPPEQVDDWSRAWEYLTRMWQKNDLEDAKKCRWYLDKLIEKMSDKLK